MLAQAAIDQQKSQPKPDSSKRPKLKSSDVTGLKYFAMLSPLLERLQDDGCLRDKAHNRTLHYDQYCMLILLYLFNPTITSLRAIEQASQLDKVKKKLGCSRASLGSLSEASRVFDGSRLEEIIGELGVQLNKLPKNPKLADIQQTITLVDWTLVSALPSIMNASLLKASSGSGLVKWRLHTYFEVDRYVPTRIDVTGNSGGEHGVINDLSATSFTDHGVISDSGFPEGWFFGVEESDIGG